MTSPTELAKRALELAEKATPGPWEVIEKDGIYSSKKDDYNNPTEIVWETIPYENVGVRSTEDAHFIAESRTLLPALAEAVLDLEEKLKVAQNALKFYSKPSALFIGKEFVGELRSGFISEGDRISTEFGTIAREALKKLEEK